MTAAELNLANGLERSAVNRAYFALARDEVDTLLAHAQEFVRGVRLYLDAHPPPGT
jgi:hypothetical protein